jgi:glycosyltransferase involved in cell wall biosynthesis
MPVFSIIVPAYSMHDYFEEALDSIAGQSFDDLEAIIVDDGSTDATAEIAKRFCARDSRFQYLNQQNRGPRLVMTVESFFICIGHRP